MKNRIINVLFACLFGLTQASQAEDITITNGSWRIIYRQNTKTLEYVFNGQTVLAGVYVQAKDQNIFLKSSAYEKVSVNYENVSDVFGNGEKYIFTYSGLAGKSNLEQNFYFYPDREYFLTEAFLLSEQETSSNYIAPVVTETRNSFLVGSKDNRILSVPFDNDGWVRYSSLPLMRDSVSFEVTCAYDGISRKGFVIGSVEHDTWKTGIRYSTKENQYVDRLECFGGIVHRVTNDVYADGSRPSLKRHGSIHGKRLKSPKIFVGLFDDWRLGMEAFGEANALVAPPRKWNGGNIFGWNSWGAMQKGLNYDGIIDVSDFVKDELMSKGFRNDNTAYIILDSYWDNLTPFNLKKFADYCKANGQVPGIYWAPFSDWIPQQSGRQMEGSTYKYEDTYLLANRKPRWIASGSRALDPTHPGTQARINYQISQFRQMGFKYIKIDFINNAALEADSYFDKTVTTGMQAYNKGMKFLCDACGDDMFMALSIAPAFPSQYGNSRRISCDAYANAGDCEYVLNSLSFGWWLDKVYNFNDADHLVLDGQSDKVNRMRITSGVITGTYILGDNFSQKGTAIGTLNARERAKTFATNTAINDIARIGKSFRPVEGYMASGTNKAEELFMLETDADVYFVVFNVNQPSKNSEMELPRLGLSAADVDEIIELWSGSKVSLDGETLKYSVPLNDVKVFRLRKTGGSGIVNESIKKYSMNGYMDGPILILNSDIELTQIRLYSLDGVLLKDCTVNQLLFPKYEINISELPRGLFIAKAITKLRKEIYCKFIR